MTFVECQVILNICQNLIGKRFEKKYVFSLFTAPLNKSRTKEMMENIMNEQIHLNLPITDQYEHFQVLVLLVDNYTTEVDLKYTVTPIEEVLNRIFIRVNDC